MNLKHAFACWSGCVTAALFVLNLHLCAADAPDPRPLAGEWRFQLDRADAGVAERWFTRALPDTIKLPGDLTGQGIGNPVTVDTKWIGGIVDKSWFTAPEFAEYRAPGNVKIPFWLQPELYYAGAAWFQRDIEMPEDWKGKRVVLFLERAHWETRVWLNDRLIGTNNALATPHEYDLGSLTPGKHTLTIRVDNRMVIDVGENSHSVSDHTQGNWSGIVGKIELRATPLVWIEDLQVHLRIETKSAVVRGRLGNATGRTGTNTVGLCLLDRFDARPRFPTTNIVVICTAEGGTFEAEVQCGNEVRPWDEFNPQLFELTVRSGPRPHVQTKTVLFGFREISTAGTQFTINGQKTFFRGTLECAIFPKTGHPPTDVESWQRIIRIAKAHGLNMIRFHSWCPPEAAFVAADELGFYFQVEASTWPNQSTTLGDGKLVDQWLYEETDRILKYYGNHPSFILMAHGNEPGGRNHREFLSKYVSHYKARDPRRLWTSGAGWPQLPENQFHVTPDPRIQAWGGGLKSRINAKPPETTTDYRDYIAARSAPVISHEIGQWCVYPNFDEMPKYTGYLKPRNFEIFRDRLAANGLAHLAKQFLLASGKLQALCYKEDIESALRTPGMGGFQLLDLHDFPGQGTALVGVLDPFWEEKGYITAQEYSRFCNSTVPLARLPKRVFTTDETLEAEIEVAHFGAGPLSEAVAAWKLMSDDGKIFAGGQFVTGTNVPFAELMKIAPPVWYFPPHGTNLPAGGGFAAGKVSVELQTMPAPARYRLVVAVASRLTAHKGDFMTGLLTTATAGDWPNGPIGARRMFENDWDIWVYPSRLPNEPTDVLVTAQFDEVAQARLRSGGKVLLTIPGKQVRNFDTAPVKLGFSSIFWNTAWTRRQAPTTLGILCDPKHPALAQFPTEFHSNWQWWYLRQRAGALRLDLLPRGVEPIVRVIDDWFTARPLGLIVEGKVGAGKIVVCGFDLTGDADDPVSRQMRASLVRYMGSKEFEPVAKFTPEQTQNLITPPKAGALRGIRRITASSEQDGHEAANVIDGDPNTMWHTVWGGAAPGLPHDLVLEFDAPRTLSGLALLPRQDGNRNGWIKDYELHVSADGRDWAQPVAKGSLPATERLQEVRLAAPVEARFVRLRVVRGHAHGPWASLAELTVRFHEP
jgi:hypothetical protein